MSKRTRKAQLPAEDEVLFRASLCSGVACAPATMPRRKVEAAVNEQHPTGISSRWTISRKRKLDDGNKHPAPCLEDATRRHYLMEC
jgi:hypothetical protein